jgi:hypothetical protein
MDRLTLAQATEAGWTLVETMDDETVPGSNARYVAVGDPSSLSKGRRERLTTESEWLKGKRKMAFCSESGRDVSGCCGSSPFASFRAEPGWFRYYGAGVKVLPMVG